MKRLFIGIIAAALLSTACSGTPAAGDTVLGVESASAGAASTPAASARPAPVAARPSPPLFTELTLPAGTPLELRLTSGVASDTSRVEDAVSAELVRAVTIDGREVLPAGTPFTGVVTNADESGRVKGRASITLAFTSLRVDGDRYDARTEAFSRRASATKSEDATKIGIGAGAGAIIGGILGGKKGAAQGAAVGGGAGTGVVLATRGEEVRLGPGADVSTRLSSPLTVHVTN